MGSVLNHSFFAVAYNLLTSILLEALPFKQRQKSLHLQIQDIARLIAIIKNPYFSPVFIDLLRA